MFVGGLAVTATTVTNDHIIFVPPEYDDLKDFREKKARSKREGSRRLREAGDDVSTTPDKRSNDKKYSADYFR